MKFTIYRVRNGYLLNIVYGPKRVESYVYDETQRMRMLAVIDKVLGDEPPVKETPPR